MAAAPQHDQVGQGHLSAVRRGGVELRPDRIQRLQHAREVGRVVDRPVLLRGQPHARPVGPSPLVRAAEGGGRCPGRRDQLRDREAGAQDPGFQPGHLGGADQWVVDGRDGILPDQLLLRHERAEVALNRAHVAVRQLEPGACEGVGELVGIVEEAPGDLLISGVETKCEVGGQHGGDPGLRWIEGVRDRGVGALGLPLLRPGRALRQLPLEAEEVLEEVVAPPGRRLAPDDLRAAGNGVCADACAVPAAPAQTLVLDDGAFGLRSDEGGIPAPWVFPNVCPPAMSATVSSSFIAMRAKVSRMSRAEATGSGLPPGPSGLT